MTPHRVPPRAAAAGPSRRARARETSPLDALDMLAAVRTASRDDAAMHRAVIAVAAGTAVAMLAVRQRAIRNAIASALTVRARRDARRRRGTTRDRAREGRRGAEGGMWGVDARAGVAWIGSDGRGGDAIRGDARVSRDGGRRRAGTRRAGRRAARAWARSDAFASREVTWNCVDDARWSGEWMRRARMGWRRDARANERLTRRRRFPRTRAGMRERVRRGR